MHIHIMKWALLSKYRQRYVQLHLPTHYSCAPCWGTCTLSVTSRQNASNWILNLLLFLSFLFPGQIASILSQLLGHEGTGSPLHYLKKQQWAISISAGK